jgi:hypothetical protein
MLNSKRATKAANTRWEYHTHALGETLKAASVRLDIPYRTINRWKDAGKVELRNGLWWIKE